MAQFPVGYVNYASIHDYDDVWGGIYSASYAGRRYCDGYSNSGDGKDDDGSDGMDPINFWGFKGAPTDMQEMVKRSDEENEGRHL